MTILELNFERTWRGGERQTLLNMLGFRESGITCHLLCRKGYPLEARARAEGFTVFAFANIFQALGFLLSRCRGYQVLHAQTSHILSWVLLARPFHGAKVLFTRRVDFVPRGMFTRIKYRAADRLIAISTAVQHIVAQFSGKEVVVISDIVGDHRLDKAHGQQMLALAGAYDGRTILGTTAAFVPHKDPLNMVQAIKLLADRRRDFLFLHFGNGELVDDVRLKIEEYGLQDVYKLMGFHKNVEDIFSVLDVFVMSSQEEGLGSSVLDAFVYKVPVVATNAGGLSDIVGGGRGVLCAKRDAAALAAGLQQLLEQPAVGEQNAERAYTYVNGFHSRAYITKQYLDVIAGMGV